MSNLFAQAIYDKSFNDSCSSTRVLLSASQSIYLTGYKGNAVVIKTDLHGNKIWAREYFRPNDNTVVEDLIEVGNKIIMVGETLDTILPLSFQNTKVFFILSIDSASGTILNSIIFGDSLDNTLYKIIKSKDGNLVAVGQANNGPLSYDQSNGFIIKIDTDLNIIWARKYISNDLTIFGDIIESDDSYFYITGIVNFTGTDNFEAILVKTDTTGNIVWSKKYKDGTNALTGGTIHLTNNKILISGSNEDLTNATFFGIYSMSLDTAGNLQWFKLYMTNSVNSGRGVFKKNANEFLTGDSNYICATDSLGNIKYGIKLVKYANISNICFTSDFGFVASSGKGLGLIKVDSTQAICETVPALFNQTTIQTIVDSSGFLVSTSFTPILKGNLYEQNVFTKDTTYCQSATGIFENFSENSAGFSFFPNPVLNSIQVELQTSFGASLNKFTIQIYSILSLKMKSLELESNQVSQNFDISQLPSGLYFIGIKGIPGSFKKLIKFN